MPIYNNPVIGRAAETLAQMFAPPSGAEAAGWANANASREEAARRAEAFAYAKSPDYDRKIADRIGVLGDFYDPTSSFEAVDQANATSRSNNAATVAGALEQQKLSSLTGMFGPLSEDQVRPAVPANIAGRYGASGAIPQAEGRVGPMSTDETIAAVMADMPEARLQQFATDKFAPNETQVQGQERRRLNESGLVTDQDLADAINGAETPVQGVVNGKNTFLSPGAAIRTGAEPAPSGPLVSIDNSGPADGDLRKKLDEAEGKRWSDLQAAAVTSSGLQQDMTLLSELIDQAPQGPIVGRLSEYFPEATTAGAAFQSVVSRAAPGLRVEGSGSTSDVEYAGMMKSLPRLRNRPEANRLIVEMMQAKADINIRRGAIVNAYQTGEIDAAEARRRLSAINSQSIMTPELQAMMSGNEAAPDAVTAPGEPATPVDGATAINPSTGERLILRNGQWVPAT